MPSSRSVWIGADPREVAAFAVARGSIRRKLTTPLPIKGIILKDLERDGLYTRKTEIKDGKLWDTISGAPMSTEFAISRFFTPLLAKDGWALFVDCDVMARVNLNELFQLADPKYALMCVQHDYTPKQTTKMDGQIQTVYSRKNWSSVMLFNVDHPSNKNLTLEMLNTVPGRDLHRFCWLKDTEIGALDPKWNFLVGESPATDAAIVHFTLGAPCMPGYESVQYADEWREELNIWAR